MDDHSAPLAPELGPTAMEQDMPLDGSNGVVAHDGASFAETSPHERPLNVTDALSYLDAVKMQFHERPDVYNHFLDIMKDFKSQIIDTPGVIERVSTLFNGHPALIQGFNTFLPLGYRIECTTDAQDVSFITVTTPSGTTVQTTDTHPVDLAPYPPPQLAAAPLEPVNPPPPQSPDSGMYAPEGVDIEPALEFVQDLKIRCDPDTYKQFLEILSGRKPLTPDEQAEVFARVEKLLDNEPDLWTKFRNIMSDNRGRWLERSAQESLDMHRAGTPLMEQKVGKRRMDDATLGAASGSAAPPQAKRKRKVVEKEKEHVKPATSKAKKAKQVLHEPPASLYPPPASPRRAHMHAHGHPPMGNAHTPLSAYDESRFFDRVRRYLDSRETYHEFLKTVNLFTQDIIDRGRLVREARTYLGDSELMVQLKEILGWDDMRDRFDVAELGWPSRNAGVLDRPSFAVLNVRYGSYRKLPESEASVTCSGRDEMCRAVLNDEWVSHPTFASEDSGFLPHKKNVYEEALHRTEEERHEYDFHIDAVVRTIGVLDPINTKIAHMAPEERAAFKLKANLGGVAKAIHHRVVKKIYGRDAGSQVMAAMQESPALAIPVVLTRLKQKEEEWKHAQREWNRVWREMDVRNYEKSLDRRGVDFRAADKKATAPRTFVTQIEAAREEQRAKRAAYVDPLFARTKPRHQLEFALEDLDVVSDALKLTFSFLDRTQAQIALAERKKVEAFLRTFVPLFLMLDPVAFNSAFAVYRETGDAEANDDVTSVPEDADTVSVVSGSSRSGRSGRKGAGGSAGDLRKKLLKSEQAKSTSRKVRAKEGNSPAGSRRTSPSRAPSVPRFVGSSSGVSNENGMKAVRAGSFFCNTNFYVLLRLFELLYSRISLVKGIAAGLVAEPSKSQRPVPSELAQIDERVASAEHFYDLFMQSCEKLFDNELEASTFEDMMRYMFGTQDAYNVFTIDKLIGAIVKQIQTILSDPNSQKVFELLKRERDLPSPTSQDRTTYQWDAKTFAPEENLFRVDWLPQTKAMTMQLIGKDDDESSDEEASTERWQNYVDAFVSSERTAEGVPASKIRRPFLRRNQPPPSAPPPDVIARGGLEIKVCVRTYRLFFVAGTEDSIWRMRPDEECRAAAQGLQACDARRRHWLETVNSTPRPNGVGEAVPVPVPGS